MPVPYSVSAPDRIEMIVNDIAKFAKPLIRRSRSCLYPSSARRFSSALYSLVVAIRSPGYERKGLVFAPLAREAMWPRGRKSSVRVGQQAGEHVLGAVEVLDHHLHRRARVVLLEAGDEPGVLGV